MLQIRNISRRDVVGMIEALGMDCLRALGWAARGVGSTPAAISTT
jgi:hypothetical protein